MKSGVELIAEERQRQVEAEGWTPESDDGHSRGALADAAACYALCAASRMRHYQREHSMSVYLSRGVLIDLQSTLWPWPAGAFKPKGAIRDLARAGALIAAELDRLQRHPKEAAPGVNGTLARSSQPEQGGG